MKHEQSRQEVSIVPAAQGIGALSVDFGGLVLVGKALVSLECIETDYPPPEVQRLEDRLAEHGGLPTPGSDVEDRSRNFDDLLVNVGDRENPSQQRPPDEKPKRSLGLLIRRLIRFQCLEDLGASSDARVR